MSTQSIDLSAALAAFKRSVQLEIDEYEEEVAKCERKLSILRGKLKDPEKSFNREIKDRTLRARAILGEELPTRVSNLPKKKAEEKFFSEETQEMKLGNSEQQKVDPEIRTKSGESAEGKKGFGFFRAGAAHE